MKILIGVLGGLALFLYGMNMMGMGLQKVAGDKMKSLISILTKNRFIGVFVGALVTILIQSSSATTVMVVGFVNAGIMNLSQAIGIIMGANIGTTFTAQLIAFKLTDIAPLVITIGVAIWLFTSTKKYKEIAEVLIGFSILFIGMDFMKEALSPLQESQVFVDILSNLENPILGLLAGFGLTVAVQSSSASMGLLLALASQDLITLEMALPILYGENIGTCTTALLSSIGASKTAKRAAIMHLLFNIIGTLLFMIVLHIPIEYIVTNISDDPQRRIANAHTIFNITNVLIQLPFAGFIVMAAKKLVRGEDTEVVGLKYLDSRIIETPSIAVGMASREVLRMGKIVKENLNTAKKAFYNNDEKLTRKVFEEEKRINQLERDITEYLAELTRASLTYEQHGTLTTLLNTVNDLERVGDHADNIAELAQYRIDNKVKLSDSALDELHKMFENVEDAFALSLTAFKTADEKMARRVIEYESVIDKMEQNYRANHIKRLNDFTCNPTSGIVFLDTISNLERISDHSSNVALSIIDAIENKEVKQ
ncbi:Na/Pi cotransporter family protein [Senegalia massiliensis]|uniref:Na/Pi cotransporter family protein n=1 Tax=Senegalia massiliensis TaxID=1720316 RepID=UPI001A910593|nr:Na/Pi cotransporter family protein [Senegalia massiliensis]